MTTEKDHPIWDKLLTARMNLIYHQSMMRYYGVAEALLSVGSMAAGAIGGSAWLSGGHDTLVGLSALFATVLSGALTALKLGDRRMTHAMLAERYLAHEQTFAKLFRNDADPTCAAAEEAMESFDMTERIEAKREGAPVRFVLNRSHDMAMVQSGV